MDRRPQKYTLPPSSGGPSSDLPLPPPPQQQQQPVLSQLSQLSISTPLLAQQDNPSQPTPSPLASSLSYPSLPPPPPSSAQLSTPEQVAGRSDVVTLETHPIHLPFQDILGGSLSSSSSSPRPQSHPEPRQRRPAPHPLRPALSSARSRTAGPASASPSTWSIASSDTGPSSASSVAESRIRFEKLTNGQHRHHLSAPKRQQFLSNQVRRLRELLDGKRERDDQQQPLPPLNNASQGQLPQLQPDVYEHPLSLLNEKYQDLDNEQSMGSPSGGVRRPNSSIRTDFVQKYGDLQQVVGKGKEDG